MTSVTVTYELASGEESTLTVRSDELGRQRLRDMAWTLLPAGSSILGVDEATA